MSDPMKPALIGFLDPQTPAQIEISRKMLDLYAFPSHRSLQMARMAQMGHLLSLLKRVQQHEYTPTE